MANPLIAGRSPMVRDEIAGERWWCACGRSKTQPFCDGSHAGTGIDPIPVTIHAPRKVAWCACKHSKKKPFCDGSHKSLPTSAAPPRP